MPRLRALLPLLVIFALLAAAYASGLHRELSWATLAAHRAALHDLVAVHPAAAGAGYVLLYAAVVALSLPGGAIMSAAGGLLFGIVAGAALAVVGATVGAVLLFLAARSALGPLLARRAAPLLDRIRPGLERDGFSYLLAMRLVPLVPFWLLTLAPALVGMHLAPYAAATFIGIIPAAVVFAAIGAGVATCWPRAGRRTSRWWSRR